MRLLNPASTNGDSTPRDLFEPTVYTVSDLHIGSYRSHWEAHKHELHAAADAADIFVLNGDIFDLPPLHHPDLQAQCTDALNWLETFTQQHPTCSFHLNLGNHDAVQPFVDGLKKLSRRLPNLQWDEYFVRIGHALFLHGDAANSEMDLPMLARERHLYERAMRSRLMLDLVYTMLFALRIHHWLHHMVFPRERTLQVLLHHLNEIGQGPDQGVRNVYFGHTHLRINGQEFGGVRFYNSGAPIMGLDFNILRADCGPVREVYPSRAREWLPAMS